MQCRGEGGGGGGGGGHKLCTLLYCLKVACVRDLKIAIGMDLMDNDRRTTFFPKR